MLPVIGITCAQDGETGRAYLNRPYYAAVERAGGLPVLLPPLGSVDGARAVLALLDGLLLSGGGDLDPVYFGEEPRPGTGEVAPERDAFEMALTRMALDAGLPVLGICRGLQVLNVAAGGSIWQDLGESGPNLLKHMQDAPRWHPTHAIDVAAGSRLAGILGARHVRVNSLHHQAVREAAGGFEVVARAGDGVIEALEGKGLAFVLGVQFHPEWLWERQPVFLNLFVALVEAARVYGQTRR
ncbi:MAG: gamma-glutamyl-gamma-aminobutyrate hydrolase family protein [Desulfotomaculales bacterium]